MRAIEIRRHAMTKKGASRGSGSHLSAAGVAFARSLGEASGPFDLVVTSTIPRTLETALAMGFAVDEMLDDIGPADPALYAEIGHHERWEWPEPFVVIATMIRGGGATSELGAMQERAWRSIASLVPDGGKALVISHGRVIEAGLITCFPRAPFASWGAPFRHGEGARLQASPGGWESFELIRCS